MSKSINLQTYLRLLSYFGFFKPLELPLFLYKTTEILEANFDLLNFR